MLMFLLSCASALAQLVICLLQHLVVYWRGTKQQEEADRVILSMSAWEGKVCWLLHVSAKDFVIASYDCVATRQGRRATARPTACNTWLRDLPIFALVLTQEVALPPVSLCLIAQVIGGVLLTCSKRLGVLRSASPERLVRMPAGEP